MMLEFVEVCAIQVAEKQLNKKGKINFIRFEVWFKHIKL